MKRKTRGLSTAASAIFACLAAMALCMSFPQPELSQSAQGSGILNMMENLRRSLDGTAIQTSIFAAAFFLRRRWNEKRRRGSYILLPLICFLIAVIWLMGEGFIQDNSLRSLTSGAGQQLKCCIYLLGSAWLLTQLAVALDILISSGADLSWKREGRLTAFYRRHAFLCPFILILLSCALPLILAYPGGMNADSWGQAGMFFKVVRPDWGLYEFTSHHPPAHTVYFASIIALGKKLGSANLGLFTVMLLQAGMYSAVFAYSLYAMRRLGAPRYLRIISLLAILFSPYFVSSYPMVIKDNVYSWAILLFVIELIYMLYLGRDYWRSKGHIALLALGLMGSMLFRNNGKYVIYPMILLMLIILSVRNRKEGRKSLLKPALALLLPVLAANLILSGLMSYYDIEKGSIREALSLPIQQTARYVLERGDEVTEEEKAAISAVLDYDNLASDYYPMESDAVKDKFNPDADAQDVLNYLKTWLKQGLKHPFVYIKATVNQNYPLVYPFQEGNQISVDTLNRYHLYAAESIGITDVEVMPRLNNIRNEFNHDLMYLPFTGAMCNIATYVLALLFFCCYALRRRLWDFFVPALPLLLSLAIVAAAPGIRATPRYAYPILYSLPVVMSWYCFLSGKAERQQ